MWRACWAEGSAIVTTEASSTIISCATAMIARARKRLGSGGATSDTPERAGSMIWLADDNGGPPGSHTTALGPIHPTCQALMDGLRSLPKVQSEQWFHLDYTER